MRTRKNIHSKISFVRKRNHKFNNFLRYNHLNGREYKHFSIMEKRNILLKNFVYLLRLDERSEKDYEDSINFLRICARYLFFCSSKNNVDRILKKLSKVIENIAIENDLYGTSVENLEEKIVNESGYKFTDEEMDNYFSYHKIYTLIGNVFASGFKSDQMNYYEYGYYLAMYLNMYYFANKNMIRDNVDIFLIKLITNKYMTIAISDITPEYFNLFIIKNNRWMNRVNYNKLIKEVKDYEEKL
ncbi:hypothetical protein [[Acholeplasma] multilocale]|uniref:hypothetical protein n=1 Tax=[Acholeplasma] multilocale TaxID=264638 RepID=UPI00047CE2EE|nr:hypothetical protein [[Acholeplasma] multilocale]